jgi:hypothetical protein
MHLAALGGFSEAIDALINLGHPVHVVDHCGWPPLLYANFQANEACVLALVQVGGTRHHPKHSPRDIVPKYSLWPKSAALSSHNFAISPVDLRFTLDVGWQAPYHDCLGLGGFPLSEKQWIL